MFLIKSWCQGVAAFTHLAFLKIHFMLFILSFQTVVCFSVALQTSSTSPDPDLQHSEALKTQTLLLCKSFGKNKKKFAGGSYIMPSDRRQKSFASESQQFLLFKHCRFAVQNKQPVLLPISCPLLCTLYWSPPNTHCILSSDKGFPTLLFSDFNENWIQENETRWPNAIIAISVFI